HQLWVSAYDASPKVLGQTITLNGTPRWIVGVAPPGLHFLEGRFQGSVGAWMPAGAPGARETYGLLARLMPNVSLSEARAGLDTIAARLALQDPAEYEGWTFTVTPVHELLTGDVRPALLLLLGATALVLLIAIVNVANLLLARGWQRAKGVAVQIALGATRPRVIFQWAIESSLLGLLGGLAGLLLALLGMRLFREFASPNLLRMPTAHMNWAVIGLCVGVALVAGVLIGVVPAIQISRLDPNAVLRSGDVSGRTGESCEVRKAMRGLMVAEIALALTVTASSMLLVRSFASLTGVHTGMRMRNLLTLRVSIPPETYARYSKPKQWKPFVQNLLALVRSVPGVESAGASDLPVLIGLPNIDTPVRVNGVTMNRVGHRMVTPGYFRTLGIPVLAGRTFGENSMLGATGSMVIINQAFAKLVWKDRNPIGRRFDVMAGDHPLPVEVIAVVGNTRNRSLAAKPEPAFYAPFYQWPFHHLAFVVHTAVDPTSLTPTIERQIWAVNQRLAIWHVRTMKQLIAENEAGSRSRALLLAIFASLGLVLAVVGVYGVFSYAVTRRTHEFGIRMALGAKRGDVLRIVLLEGARLAAFGVVAGLAGMFIFAHLTRSLLFGVAATDPATLAETAFLITLISLLACCVPALRASRTDPASALRHE
ncbi:MAG: FtsX-like permease family protein, partial [Gemmataceae bacterium]